MISKSIFILVESLPTYGGYWGARALKSPDGKGVILQHETKLYELYFDSTKLTWRQIEYTLTNKLRGAILTYLPGGYKCRGKKKV